MPDIFLKALLIQIMIFYVHNYEPRPQSYPTPFYNTCLISVQTLMPTIHNLNSSTVQLLNNLTVE